MCGIWARTQFDQEVRLEDLAYPVQALSHRGPDDYGWWLDEKVALVHTRLSINDLSEGGQPLTSYDGQWIGIVNGELYDYKKIREELLSLGVTFKTKSDSEVLLNLFVKKGAESFSQISGEFAYIFYHIAEEKLYYGRDGFGVKPLFFEKTETSFTLASEMKAIRSSKPAFNEKYLLQFLAHTVVPPETCLQNIYHVWPGRCYELNLKTKELTSKTVQALPLFQKRHLRGAEAIELLDETMRASVKRRLVADVEVGAYLSGGIDSALILSLANHLGAKTKAFTVGFNDSDYDESKLAGKIAQDLGIEHQIVMLGSKNFMPHLIKSVVAFENPIMNPHGAAKNLLSEFAAKSVKVVLTGEGSDELFGGYAYTMLNKLRKMKQKHPKIFPNHVLEQMQTEMAGSLKHLDGISNSFTDIKQKYFGPYEPHLFGRLAKSRLFNMITNKNLRNVFDQSCQALSQSFAEECTTKNFSEWDLNSWMSIRTDLMHYILANVGDRQEMAHSIEGRTPFLDPAVAALAGRIHERDLLKGTQEKYIVRKVSEKYLKPEHVERRKRPFFAPNKYLYLRENRSLITDYIKRAEESVPNLNWPYLQKFLKLEVGSSQNQIDKLENVRVSTKLFLFSVGVLSEKLNTSFSSHVRGYKLPQNAEDLLLHKKMKALKL